MNFKANEIGKITKNVTYKIVYAEINHPFPLLLLLYLVFLLRYMFIRLSESCSFFLDQFLHSRIKNVQRAILRPMKKYLSFAYDVLLPLLQLHHAQSECSQPRDPDQ